MAHGMPLHLIYTGLDWYDGTIILLVVLTTTSTPRYQVEITLTKTIGNYTFQSTTT